MMKFYSVAVFIFSFVFSFGQASLPVSRTTWNAGAPTGWTDNGTSSYTSSFACSGSNMGQLNSTGDYYQVYFSGTPNMLSYSLKATGATTSSCLVEESADGSSWATLVDHTSLPTASTPCTGYSYSLASTTRYVRWTYTKVTQNLGLDDVSISVVSGAEINLQEPVGTDQACGFAYNFGTQTIGAITDVTIRIQNLGAGLLSIGTTPISGTHAGEFSIQTAPAATVAASGFTDMVVRFSPGLPGTKTALLTINSDDADESACTVLLSANGVYTSCSELIISEYGEPSSGNGKYLEIYNGSATAIDLSDYQLWKVSDGGTWPEFTLSLPATMLAPGQTYAIANNSIDVSTADLFNVFCNWNGDDAVGLAKNISGTYYLIDAVGTDGADPGTGWQVAGVNNATVDHTLVRKTTVTIPNADWISSAGGNATNSEWYILPYYTSGIGCHVNACTTVPTVSFDVVNTVVTESGTTLTIDITMDVVPVSLVQILVGDALLGTAAPGTDYTLFPGLLYFAVAYSYPHTETFTIDILDDAISESNENIVLNIIVPNCDALIGNGTHTITILDDEIPEGIIINEFSQGSSSKEYVELVVTGTPGTTIDLQGWIIDDNSGIFSGGYGTQMGIAPGHLKFSNICTWEKVPVGSIILLYNASDKNASIALSDDPTDADLDYTYVIGILASSGSCSGMATANLYFSSDCVIPNNTSYDTYTPPSYTNADWNAMQFRNQGDAIQVRSAAGGFFHGLSYGNKGSGSDCSTCAITQANHPDYPIYAAEALYFSGTTNTTYSFQNTTDDDYRKFGNWTKTTSSSPNALETPGAYNNAANQSWIESLRSPFGIVTDDQFYTCDLRAYESRYYLDGSDRIIFYIKNNGATDHGSFTSETILHDDATAGLGFQNSNLSGTPVFMQKTFAGTPTVYSPADYQVTFYMTTQELQDFCDYINPIIDAALSTTGTNFTPATIKGFLKIYRTSNTDRAWTVVADGQTEIAMPFTGTYGSYHSFKHNGFSSFSGYALGVPITELISSILPVELINFAAICQGDKIEISWITASEEHAAYFDLERSYDAANFSRIASIPAAGFSVQLRNYLFVDDNFTEQKQLYYRLKQVDLDGSFEYSNIVTQKCGQAVPLVAVYPNPAHGILFIDFAGNAQQYDQVLLYDVTGRLMKRLVIKNAGQVQMDISGMAAGVYILSAEHPGGWSFRQKIIKE